MQYITIEQYKHDVGVLNCRIAGLTTKIGKIEAILNEMQIADPQKENENLRGEKSEGITKEARDTFEMAKGSPEGYLMALSKEDPEYIPLQSFFDRGGILGSVKRIKVGVQVFSDINLLYDSMRIDKYKVYANDGAFLGLFKKGIILVYNTLQK